MQVSLPTNLNSTVTSLFSESASVLRGSSISDSSGVGIGGSRDRRVSTTSGGSRLLVLGGKSQVDHHHLGVREHHHQPFGTILRGNEIIKMPGLLPDEMLYDASSGGGNADQHHGHSSNHYATAAAAFDLIFAAASQVRSIPCT